MSRLDLVAVNLAQVHAQYANSSDGAMLLCMRAVANSSDGERPRKEMKADDINGIRPRVDRQLVGVALCV